MLIRTAAVAEYPAIEALLERAYEPVLQAMAAEHAQSFRQALSALVGRYGGQGSWIVAERDDRLLGCVAYFAPHSVQHRHFDARWSHVQLLGVDAVHTRRGVGTALLRRCLAMAQSDGAEALALQTSELMAPARKLYEELGLVLERPLDPAFGHPSYLYLTKRA